MQKVFNHFLLPDSDSSELRLIVSTMPFQAKLRTLKFNTAITLNTNAIVSREKKKRSGVRFW